MRIIDSIGWLTALQAATLAVVPAARADHARTNATVAAAVDTVYACVDNRGNPRMVNGPGQCSKGEADLSWNQVGPQGPAGAQGAAGQPRHDCLHFRTRRAAVDASHTAVRAASSVAAR